LERRPDRDRFLDRLDQASARAASSARGRVMSIGKTVVFTEGELLDEGGALSPVARSARGR
jgi:hypothetical protein